MLFITVDPQLIIQRYSYRDRLTTQRFGDTVTIAANLDIAVPGHMADVEVAGIEVRIRQRRQMLLLECEALLWCLSELAKLPFVSHISYPLLQLLVNMGEAVKSAVPDEEILFKIFNHPLRFAFGSGPARAAGPWQEIIVVSQQQEPGVEHHFSVVIFQHRRFLVINQHRFHTATEVSKGSYQLLIGVFSILLWRGEDMEATGEPQRVNREVNFASLPGDLHLNFAPVVLQLVTGLSFEAYCFL